MSLLSNPNVVRMGIYSTWSSSWYENNPIYSTLIYTDLYINEFLNGIYYKLKMPTALPIIREIGYDQIIITTKSLVSFKKRRFRMKKLTSYLSSIKLRHRKLLLLLRRALRKVKILNFYKRNNILFNLNKIEKYVKNKEYKNKQIKLNKILKYKKQYINFIKNVKYKIRERKKRLRKIKKYVFRNLLYKLENIKNKKKNKLILDSFNSLNNFKKNKQVKNRIIYRNKRKYQLNSYKKNIIRNRKYKINSKVKKISKKRAIKRKYYFKINTNTKRKYKNRMNLKKINNNIKNKNIILFNWLMVKINQWFFLLILKIIITYNIVIGNKLNNENNIIKKSELVILNLLNKNKNNINIIEKIKNIKNILLQLNYISNFKIKLVIPFSKKKKIIQFNFRDKIYHYMRIKSYYRRKKRIKRYKKLKELSLRFPPKVYTLNVRLFKSLRKWSTFYYKKLLYKQLQLKIRDTLSSYLYKFIIFIPYYYKKKFPRLDSPKLLADYIKFSMKYENRNPSILKKIVSSHSSQKKKQRKLSYSLMKRLFKLRRKIRFKLSKHNKIINMPFIHKVKINKKIKYTKTLIKNEKKRKINLFKYRIKNKKYNKQYFYKNNKLIKKNSFLNLSNYSNLVKKRKSSNKYLLKKINNKELATSIYKFNYNNNKIKLLKISKVKDDSYSTFWKNINKIADRQDNNISNKYDKITNMNNKFISNKQNKYNKNKKYNKKEYIHKLKKEYISNFKNKKGLITHKLNSIYYYKKNTLKNLLNKTNKENSYLKKNNDKKFLLRYLLNWRFKFRDLSYKKYPLVGMRIECNGPTKKGRRTQTHLYNEWVDFYRLPGTMPLVTIMNDIQYWQTYGLTKRAAIGIKLWMHFYPSIYSEEKKQLLNQIK
jgi:hypothetical protein